MTTEHSTEAAIILSTEALEQARRLHAELPDRERKKLRLYLDGKGCDGFFYGVSFDAALPDDLIYPQTNGVDLIVDAKTFMFVQGSVIDWVDDERGRGFLVNNPAHNKYRGKFYKRPSWQKQALGKDV